VGVAVNVTEVPVHMVVADALMLTLAGRLGLTTIVIVLLVTGEVEAQVAFDVISTVTVLPFASVFVVKVELFVPTLAPFTFH
jgi:hypothetical protein